MRLGAKAAIVACIAGAFVVGLFRSSNLPGERISLAGAAEGEQVSKYRHQFQGLVEKFRCGTVRSSDVVAFWMMCFEELGSPSVKEADGRWIVPLASSEELSVASITVHPPTASGIQEYQLTVGGFGLADRIADHAEPQDVTTELNIHIGLDNDQKPVCFTSILQECLPHTEELYSELRSRNELVVGGVYRLTPSVGEWRPLTLGIEGDARSGWVSTIATPQVIDERLEPTMLDELVLLCESLNVDQGRPATTESRLEPKGFSGEPK